MTSLPLSPPHVVLYSAIADFSVESKPQTTVSIDSSDILYILSGTVSEIASTGQIIVLDRGAQFSLFNALVLGEP